MRCIIRDQKGDNFPLSLDRQEKVSETRKIIADHLGSNAADLRLIYLGKQLEDDLTLYDYSVKDNDTILVFKKIFVAVPEVDTSNEAEISEALPNPSKSITVSNSTTTNDTLNEADHLAIMAAQEEIEACKGCDNTQESECKECGCNVCGKKNDEALILICDECQYYFHIYCLPTPLTEVPKEDEWYCHECYNDPSKIIKAGETEKIKVKKDSNRKWDKGMSCASVLKKCTIVKPDHVGAIPGVPVGSSFRYRVHLSESGVHRPPVSGIHGSSKTRAVSIVLAGGYIDDKDYGNYFLYTGSGGRDLSGNKRTAEQSMDQELTRSNLALALTMNQPINKNGAVAEDWKKSSPVRVVRSYKLAKESKFAPAEGIRYDGLYKLVRYWTEPGQNGFLVWRYEFRRDDPEPAPWTKKGKARIEQLGLTMYCPEGYVVPNAKSEMDKAKAKGKKGSGRSRKEEEEAEAPTNKKAKAVAKIFKPHAETLKLIAQDLLNARTWQLILEQEYPSETAFLEAIMSKEFMCPICHGQVTDPVSTRCGHNACRPCLKQSLINYGNLCPICRGELYPELKGLGKAEAKKKLKSNADNLAVNSELVAILKHLIPSMTPKD